MTSFPTLCPWLFEPLERLERAAADERLGHGWLIAGPAGIGKTNLAYVLADRLLTGRELSEPPGPATPEDAVAAGRALAGNPDMHPDLYRVRPEEGKSAVAIEQIRALTGQLGLKPHQSARKIVVIEHADAMTTAAANALLKSLEEPTPSTFMFLLVERPGRLPATIRSRCQRLVLRPPDASGLRQWLGDRGIGQTGSGSAIAPLVAAERLLDSDKASKYSEILDNINAVFEDKLDPHALAENWAKSDPDLALGCLIDELQQRIRGSLLSGHSNPITDSAAVVNDNRGSRAETDSLFRSLRIAEKLREQIGRGTNVELALKSLLLELELNARQRVST